MISQGFLLYIRLSSNDCLSLPAIIDFAMSEDKLTPLQCKKFSKVQTIGELMFVHYKDVFFIQRFLINL